LEVGGIGGNGIEGVCFCMLRIETLCGFVCGCGEKMLKNGKNGCQFCVF
jgi:hypothetical protein